MHETPEDMPDYSQPTVTEVAAEFDELLTHGAVLQGEIDAGRGTPEVVAALANIEAQTHCKFELLELLGAFSPPDSVETAD